MRAGCGDNPGAVDLEKQVSELYYALGLLAAGLPFPFAGDV